MKRLNPKTNKPFKRGDKRKDGLVFCQYKRTKILSNGYFKEHWCTPEQKEKYRLSAYDNRRSEYGTQIHQQRKDQQKQYSKKYMTVPLGRAKHMISGAKKRGIVTITPEWLEEKIKTGKCELTGLPFDLLQSDFFHNPYSPSLDRIDSSNKEYSPKNTRVVLTAVNNSINQYGDEVMLPILKAMVRAIEKNVKARTIT